MKVILIKDVKNIGVRGDAKEVESGYAYNFLIPRGLAVEEKSIEAKNHIKHKSKVSSQKEEKIVCQKKTFDAIPEKILLQVPASEKGTLFSKITSQSISEHFKEKGVDVPKDWFSFTSIDSTGDYPVRVEYQNGSKETTISITKDE